MMVSFSDYHLLPAEDIILANIRVDHVCITLKQNIFSFYLDFVIDFRRFRQFIWYIVTPSLDILGKCDRWNTFKSNDCQQS